MNTNSEAKYLKYKSKYQQLKKLLEEQQGGLTMEDGCYTYLFCEQLYSNIKKNILIDKYKDDVVSNSEINKALHLVAFKVKHFTNEVELVTSNDSEEYRNLNKKFLLKNKYIANNESSMMLELENKSVRQLLNEQNNEVLKQIPQNLKDILFMNTRIKLIELYNNDYDSNIQINCAITININKIGKNKFVTVRQILPI